jgi:hypothetical protein
MSGYVMLVQTMIKRVVAERRRRKVVLMDSISHVDFNDAGVGKDGERLQDAVKRISHVVPIDDR